MTQLTNLGVASGRIEIDVSSVLNAVKVVQQAARDMTASLNTVNQSTATSVTRRRSQEQREMEQSIRATEREMAKATQEQTRALRQAEQEQKRIATAMVREFQRAAQEQARAQAQAAAAVERETQRINNAIDKQIAAARNLKAQQQSAQLRAMGSQPNPATMDYAPVRNVASQLEQSLTGLANAMLPFSAATAGIGYVGIQAAANMEQLEIRFRALYGSQENAQAAFVTLRTEMERFNLPVIETLQAMGRLIPILRATGNEEERFVGLTARLVALNPQQGFEGAAIAISEALSGTGNDFRSLQERFNIPRALLRQAVGETENFADALDLALSRLGVTEEAATAVGNSFVGAFRAARDAVSRLLGTALRPILDGLITPVLNGFADIVQFLDTNARGLTTVAAGFALVTSALAPALFGLSQMVSLLRQVTAQGSTAGRVLGGLGRVGAAAAVVAGGVEVGIAAARAIDPSLGSQEEARARLGEILGQLSVILGQVIGEFVEVFSIGAAQIEKVIGFIGAAIQSLGLAILTGGNTLVQTIVRAMLTLAEQLGVQLPDSVQATLQDALSTGAGRLVFRDSSGQMYSEEILTSRVEGNATALARRREEAQAFADTMGLTVEYIPSYIAQQQRLNATLSAGILLTEQEADAAVARVQGLRDIFTQLSFNIAEFLGLDLTPNAPATPVGGGDTTSGFGFSQEQIDAFREFREEMLDMEREYNERRAEVIREYEQRRYDIILRFNEALADLDAKEMERRLEAQQDLDEEIADIQQDAAESQADAYQKLQDEIAKILRDSRIRILEAASRLDARAIFEEQRRRNQRIQDAVDGYNEEEEERQQQSARRIQELREDFAKEEAERRQAYDRRRSEMIRQNQQDLMRLQMDHNQRLSEMLAQYSRERMQRQNAFAQEFNDLAGHNGRMLSLHRIGQAQIENELLIWYNRMRSQMGGGGGTGTVFPPLPPAPAPLPGRPAPTPYADGTNRVPATGTYTLHAGEAVLRPEVAALYRGVLGQNFTQAAAARAIVGGSGSSGTTVDMRGASFMFGDIGQYSRPEILDIVEEGMQNFFNSIAGGRALAQ